MDRSYWSRVVTIVAVALFSVWFLVPTYYSLVVLDRADRNNLAKLEERMPFWAPPARYRLSLGLDLQGGIYMIMRVDTKTALQKATDRRAYEMSRFLADRKLGEVTYEVHPEKLEVVFRAKDASTLPAIVKELGERYPEFTETARDGAALTLQMSEAHVDSFKSESVDRAMLVVRRRIDKWGVAEVDVRRLGADSIQISLPGQQDPEQAKELIGTTAQLEFRMVDPSGTVFQEMVAQHPLDPATGVELVEHEGMLRLRAPTREAILSYAEGKLPAEREVLTSCLASKSKKDLCEAYVSYLVEKTVPLTGEGVVAADVSMGQFGDPEVQLTFNAQGAKTFEDLTGANVGRNMAIVLDDNVQSDPRINERIPGGNARITMGGAGGQNRLEEAKTLALVLKAGALPAPMTTAEIRQVGASLGDELIRRGSLAVVVGFLLVVVFMAIYYRTAGLVADVALVLNGALILAGLAMFSATLTLPGIAGFVLTLGIAVDANVLINERIREELRNGKTARAAVDQGYDRAFWTIFDAHVTTLIAGTILFFTGTGPVRGFATALIVGIVASLFTSIVVTRVITTYLVHGRNAQTVSV